MSARPSRAVCTALRAEGARDASRMCAAFGGGCITLSKQGFISLQNIVRKDRFLLNHAGHSLKDSEASLHVTHWKDEIESYAGLYRPWLTLRMTSTGSN